MKARIYTNYGIRVIDATPMTVPVLGYEDRIFLAHPDLADPARHTISEPRTGLALVARCRTADEARRRLIKLLLRKLPADMDEAIAKNMQYRPRYCGRRRPLKSPAKLKKEVQAV